MSVADKWQAVRIDAMALLARSESIESQPHIACKLSTGEWVTIDKFATEGFDRNILEVIREPEVIQLLENTVEATNG
jgi:hypothetical protein